MSDKTSKPKPSRSFLWRALLWSGAVGLVIALLVAAAGGWFWMHRVEYINRLLDTMGPVRGSVADVTLTDEGAAVRGFILRDVKTGIVVARLPELSVTGGMRDILARRVRSVSLNDAEVIVTESFLEQMLEARPQDEASGGIMLPGGWQVARLDLRKARLRYEHRDGAVAEIVADCYADNISTSTEGVLSIGGQEIVVSGGAMTRGDHPAKLAELHARGRLHEGIFDLDMVSMEKSSLAMTPAFLSFVLSSSAKPETRPGAVPAVQHVPSRKPASLIRGVRIARVTCRDIGLSARGFTPGNVAGVSLPDASARVDYEATGLEWLPEKPLIMGRQSLLVNQLEIKPHSGEGRITCREINLVMPAPSGEHWSVEQFTWLEPEIHWTPDLRRLLLPPGQSDKANQAKVGDAHDASWSALLQHIDIQGARLTIADTEWLPFELTTDATLKLRDLRIDAGGVQSKEAQTIEVRDLALSFSGRPAPAKIRPFFELPQGTLAINPDAWNASKAVETFSLKNPVVRLRDGNTPWFDVVTEKVKPDADPAVAVDAGTGLWRQIQFGRIEIENASLDIATAEGERTLDAQARLTVTTDPSKPGLHRVRFEDFVARLPGLTLYPFPVARVSFVDGAVSVPEVWSTQRIDSLRIGGAVIEAGSALMKFFEQPAAANAVSVTENPKSKTENPNSSPAWTVGEFSIEDTFVTLDHLVPGMDSVNFEIALSIKDAPLSPEGLAADIAPQRIELARLQIPSPYGGPPVAKLDSVFVNFSPAGLIAKRIDKVEIVSPTLYIGEPLFWYVDYYRRYAAQQAPGPEMKLAALDKIFALQAAAAAIASEPAASQAGWDVRTLAVHSGKLVIAPKGVPLKGFRTPFPFSFTSEVSRGTLEASFDIPADNYEIPEMKLKFEGMSGHVQFNLPVKGRDNNVTEVFKVKQIRWKELHIEDAFLSVTYDLGGIYGQFGGAAYEGYVNGEFNIYNDAVYSWDGWISGKDVQTRELTQKLCPGYFFMEGKVGATVTTNGDGKEVYQTDGKFENQTPGKMSIEALNDLIKTLPESVSGLKLRLSQISLETLRDFAYDRADGRFRTYGREGGGTLKFTGPAGARSFAIKAYDHRWKIDAPPDKTKSASKDGPP